MHNALFSIDVVGLILGLRQHMKRREFMTLLGGAAAAWPLAARAQSGESIRRVGVLTNLTHNDPEGRARDDAFVQGLKELGWIELGNFA